MNEYEQLLAMLVMDFGYIEEPTYGHTPIRHQVAWNMCAIYFGDSLNDKVEMLHMQAIVEKPLTEQRMMK